MAPKIKHYRVQAGETQAQVAKALGVTQPTFQRWEAGKVDIPADALADLAKRYGASTQEIEGRYTPRTVSYYDDTAPSELKHFGECVIHFLGGGEPLVLTISEAAHALAYDHLQNDNTFIIIEDLGNRTVAVRRSAISELYFSHESYDGYGPDHERYKLATAIQMPDPRDWKIVRALANEGGIDLSGFDPENVARVKTMIHWEGGYSGSEALKIPLLPLGLEGKGIGVSTQDVLALSHTVTVRLSSGVQRDFPYCDCNLYDCLFQLEEWDFSVPEGGAARKFILPVEDGYHTAFFAAQAIDYVSLPTHKLQDDELNLEH